VNIFELFGTIAINNEEANKAIDDTTSKAEDAGEKSQGAFSKIGTAAAAVGKVVLTAGAALGTAWIAAIEGSREYRTEMGKLDTAFVTNGHSSEAATTTYKALQAVLGDTAVSVEAANHLAVMTDNEKDLSTWTDICTGVFATFGDSLPIEGLTEAANETAKVGAVTGPLADALNWAGIAEDEFNEKLAACSTEQERQKLIMDTLNDTYKGAADQYKETNKDILAANQAQEKLTSAFAELGRIGEPILTAIKTKVADMVTAALPHLESFIAKVKNLRTWIQNNQQTIKNWAAAITAAGVSVGTFLLILNWGKIMSAAAKAIKAVRSAVMLFNTTLLANPIGLVIALVAGLVAGFVLLWKNNEGLRNFFISMWAKIKSATGTAVSWIKGKFSDFKGALSTVRTTFDNIKKAIADKIDAARESVRKAIDKIKGFFKFSWSLPKIKVPSFSLKGKFSLDPPSVPKIGIKWNAAGAVFDQPTIFNTPLGFQGVGEAGPEAVAPISVLQSYVSDAVRRENEGIIRTLIEQNRIMQDFLKRTIPRSVQLDSRALIGELTPAIDRELSDRLEHAKRGNTR
jgi:hypothetical protein